MPAQFTPTPFDYAIRAFDALHPALDVTIQWVPDVCAAVGEPERDDEIALGVAMIDPEGEMPTTILLGMNQSVGTALETLVHELAHVAADCIDNSHSPEWEAAEAALWAKYTELVHASAAANGAEVMRVDTNQH